MNNRGWGLKIMIVWICVLGVALFISTSIAVEKLNLEITGNETINTSTDNDIKEEATSKVDKKIDIDYNKEYKKIEENMKKATNNYILDMQYTEVDANHLKLDLASLESNGYIDFVYDLKDNTIKCTGYVNVGYADDKFNYSPFLKCGKNYETKGFVQRNMN